MITFSNTVSQSIREVFSSSSPKNFLSQISSSQPPPHVEKTFSFFFYESRDPLSGEDVVARRNPLCPPLSAKIFCPFSRFLPLRPYRPRFPLNIYLLIIRFVVERCTCIPLPVLSHFFWDRFPLSFWLRLESSFVAFATVRSILDFVVNKLVLVGRSKDFLPFLLSCACYDAFLAGPSKLTNRGIFLGTLLLGNCLSIPGGILHKIWAFPSLPRRRPRPEWRRPP